MPNTRLLARALVPVASIVLLLAGIMLLRGQFWSSGASLTGLGVIGLIAAARVLKVTPLTADEVESLRPYLLPGLAWTIVFVLLTLSVFYVVDNSKSVETDRIAAFAWLGAVLLGLSVVWAGSSRPDGTAALPFARSKRIELLLLVLVLILALGVRTIGLAEHPYPWSGDEASVGNEALRIVHGEVTNFFEAGWSSQPNWSFVPTALLQIPLERSILGVRLVSALVGTLAVLFVYLAGREMFNPAVGLMAGAVLATLPYNVHFSRVGVNNIVDSLLSALMFWLLVRAIRSDQPRHYYIAGAAAGLTIYSYAGTRLVLILAGLTLLFLMVRLRGYLQSHWSHLVAFVAATVVSAAPQAAYFLRHPDIFIGRLGQEGILFNGWLGQQSALTGQSIWDLLLSQVTRTIMVFIASPAPGNFYNSPEPYLTVLGSILFLLGMAYALADLLELPNFVVLLWFWTVVLFGGILTLNPPANTRLLMTSPAVALLISLGAFRTLEYLRGLRLLPSQVVPYVLIGVAGVLTIQNVGFYMFEYREQVYFQDANGEYAMEVGLMAERHGKDMQIVLLGAPRVYSGFPTLEFVAPDNPRRDLSADSLAALSVAEGQKVGFFAIPENRSLLEEIRRMYPGGETGQAFRKSRPQELLFEYYFLNVQ